jgi:hypothetical protein
MSPANAVINGPVWSLAEVNQSQVVPEALKLVATWIASYVTKPHPMLGRSGVVCPFMPPALMAQGVWLSLIEGEPGDERDMCAVLTTYLGVYEALVDRGGAARELITLVLACPDVPAVRGQSLIGSVHHTMKPTIVDAGLMLGEFFPDNPAEGLHNPAFRPLRCPIPLFVYRQMVANDLVFLTKPSDPPQRRQHFIRAYLRSMGDRLSPERLREAEVALTLAERELSLSRS